MGNASDYVKSLADMTLPQDEEESVARELLRNILYKKEKNRHKLLLFAFFS